MIKTIIEFDGLSAEIRNLTRKEFRDLISKCNSELELEDEVCKLAVVHWPPSLLNSEGIPDLDNCLAGIPSRIAEMIVAFSGIGDSDYLSKYMDNAQEWAMTVEGRYDILSLFVVPGLTLETLDTCDPEELQKYYVAAQIAGEAFLRIPTLEFLDPTFKQKGRSLNSVGPVRMSDPRDPSGRREVDVEEFSFTN
jgi:hypothetical protein